ncbi:hypothetical protein TSYNTROOL_06480 [Tepidanaerobacter syntrophicus]|uniref:GldG family protein n=1 Tax=Tepidanaerobacter syntrophicus TaxID=224999 RepID=UPI0017667429|nr:GldG family protein [Tepidanaerobacter syntrophicus]GLI50562.1 hypothetical protein TSYNTROOL_06480 [Tepidanaerobacter syntrophicus]HHV82902.1 GldG family protein [Tepidanaerobacter syntrophicus]
MNKISKKVYYTFITIFLVIVLIAVNLICAQYHYRWDLTKSHRFTLSSKTKEVISQLDESIKITAFIAEGSSISTDIKNLLKEYDFASDKIEVKFIDPEKEPAIAKKYNIQDYNTIIVEGTKHQQTISPYNLYSPSANQYSMNFNGEQAITRAILNLKQQNQAVIYFLSGHGELSSISDLDSFNSFLQGEGYTTRQLDLPVVGKIPEDADLLISAGPQKDLMPNEEALLEKYIQSGGKILIFLTPTDPKVSLGGWKELIAGLGVEIHDDIVTDPQRSFYSDPLSPVPMVERHEVTQALLDKKLSVVFPYARSLAPLEKIPENLQVKSLLVTSDQAFGETDLEQSQVSLDEKDVLGPLHLAYAVSKKPASKNESPVEPNTITAPDSEIGEPIAVIVGDVAFLGAKSIGLAGNLDFAAGSINWLLQVSDDALSIPSKNDEPPFVNLTGDAMNRIFYAAVIIPPGCILAIGFVIWLKRKNL